MGTTSEGSSRNPLPAAFIAVVIVIVLLIAAAFIPVRGDALWHRVYAAYQLRGLFTAQGNREPVAPYTFGVMDIKPYDPKGVEGALGDFTEAGGVRVAIVRPSEGGVAQVRQLSPTVHALSDEPGAKAIVAVSPDGEYAAYSVASSTDQFSSRLSSWDVVLVALSTGESVTLGSGFGPQFFAHEGKTWLLYTTMNGVTVMNIAERKSFATPLSFADEVGFMAKISPDGSHIALRDGASGRFGIYEIPRIDSSLPLDITPTEAQVDAADDVTLSRSGIYATRFADGVVTVDSIPYADLSQRKNIYTFPSDAPYRFIP